LGLDFRGAIAMAALCIVSSEVILQKVLLHRHATSRYPKGISNASVLKFAQPKKEIIIEGSSTAVVALGWITISQISLCDLVLNSPQDIG
jgi:hypothetical protein